MLPLKCLVHNARRILPGLRPMSSSGYLASLEVDNEGTATVTMKRPPVNSLNLHLLQDLSTILDTLEKEKCKAMILTSEVINSKDIMYDYSHRLLFCAGLDIMEMYKPDMKRLQTFWTTLQDVWAKLFGSSFITAAAINGHAPAGGCMLALSCEYRVMVSGKFSIGLNETALGVVIPTWFKSTILNTISQRDAELALTSAKLFFTDEALKIGFIDEIATDKEDSIQKCKRFIKKFDRIPPLARAITKQKIREAPLAWMQENRTNDLHDFLRLMESPNVQQSLEMYLEGMKKKTSK